MDIGIQGFFKNKTVFLTGGTGFLGKGSPVPVVKHYQGFMDYIF